MTITPAVRSFANNNGASSSTTVAAAFTSNAAGNCIVVSVGWVDAAGTITVTGVADTAGNSYSACGTRVNNATNGFSEQLWRVTTGCVASAGTNTVTATFSVTTTFADIHGTESSSSNGAWTSDPLDAASTAHNATGNSAALASVAFTPTQANCMIVTAGFANSGTISAGTGYTLRGTGVNGVGIADKVQTTAVSVQGLLATSSSSQWGNVAAAFRDVAVVSVTLADTPSVGRAVTTTATVSTGVDVTLADTPAVGRAVATSAFVSTGVTLADTPAISRAVARPATVSAASPPGVPFLDEYISGYALVVYAAFGADPTADPSTWTLTDITSSVLQSTNIVIVRAKQNEQSDTTSASCVLTFKNQTGDFSPRRAAGKHYPYIKVGLPLQVVIVSPITGAYEQFAGKVDDIEPAWDETGNFATAVFTAHGVLAELQDDEVLSALTRAVLAADPAILQQYWALEDGTGSTQGASSLPNGTPLLVSGNVKFAGMTYSSPSPPISVVPGTTFGSGSVPQLNAGGSLYASFPAGSSSAWTVQASIFIDPSTADQPVVMFQWTEGGRLWQVISEGLTIDAVSLAVNNVVIATEPHIMINEDVRIDVHQSGGNIAVSFKPMLAHAAQTATISSATLAGITTFAANPNNFVTAADFSVGHVRIWDTNSAPDFKTSTGALSAWNGWKGEDPVTRAARTCLNANIPFGVDGGSSFPMGNQTPGTTLSILRECEVAVGGILEDGVNFGIYLHTLFAAYNPTATMTPTLQQVDPPLAPIENNLTIVNDVTATRPTGSSARYRQLTGLPYAPDGPGGIGTKPGQVNVNIRDEYTLIRYASWAVRQGTIDADRYAALPFNLAARTTLIESALKTKVWSRITVGSTYPTGGLAPDVAVIGWTTTLSRLVFAFVPNCAPVQSIQVAVYDTARYDAATSTLAAGVTAGATTISVATTDGDLWATGATSFALNVGGFKLTCTNITGASSPQPFTVSGVTNNIPVNSPVRLWDTPIYAL